MIDKFDFVDWVEIFDVDWYHLVDVTQVTHSRSSPVFMTKFRCCNHNVWNWDSVTGWVVSLSCPVIESVNNDFKGLHWYFEPSSTFCFITLKEDKMRIAMGSGLCDDVQNCVNQYNTILSAIKGDLHRKSRIKNNLWCKVMIYNRMNVWTQNYHQHCHEHW